MVITISSPANGMLSPLFRSTMRVLARVVNIVQYIPVADATAGCISSWTSIELKIRPGPKPAKLEKIATKKATEKSFTMTRVENSWSPFVNL